MKKHSLVKILKVVCIMFFTLPLGVVAEQTRGVETPINASNKNIYLVESGPVKQSRLYADGSIIELQTKIISWPVIGSDMTGVTMEDFRRMVLHGRELFENDPNKIIVSGESARNGLDLVFNVSNPPPGAVAALESVATYIENLFDDTATVYINIGFDSLPAGILGWASSTIVGPVSWTDTRNGLIYDMDADDSIQLWLPSGSTIPVRYEYSSSTVTNEDRCYFSLANYLVAIGYVPGVAVDITFNVNISWDYDPSDGVSGYCFQSVTAHEIGHALGFLCGAWMTNEIVSLDIYRFQFSDDGFDYNPDDLYEFQTTVRMVDESPGNDDVITDVISVEYRMSDGSPYQCSHFSQGNVYAIMQPAMSSGGTYYPYFYKSPDRRMFDAIGWNYLFSYYLTTIVGSGEGSVNRDPDSSSYQPGTEVELTAIPDPGWMFDHWTGALGGSNNPDTIIMDDDKTVLAYFVPLYCTLTVYIIGNGSVIKDPDLPMYLRGTEVELTAIPDPGWEFSHWTGALQGPQNPDTVVMDGNKTVIATFLETGVAENQGRIIDATFLDVFPNPFSHRLTIKYGISASDRAKNTDLTLYDVTGQLIKRFTVDAAGSVSAIITWDGRDNAGRKVPSGVYFLRLETHNNKITRQILLLQ